MPYVYDYFCDLVENNHPLVLGDNNLNLPRIFEIILYTFSHGVFDNENLEDGEESRPEDLKNVKERLIRIMQMIKVCVYIISLTIRTFLIKLTLG